MARLHETDHIRGVTSHDKNYRSITLRDGRILKCYGNQLLPTPGSTDTDPQTHNRLDLFRYLTRLGILFMPETEAYDFEGTIDRTRAAVYYDAGTLCSDIQWLISAVRDVAYQSGLTSNAVGENPDPLRRAEPNEMSTIVDTILSGVKYPIPRRM